MPFTPPRSGWRKEDSIVRMMVALALFAVTWLLWSGVYVPFVLVLGAASCLLVLGLSRRTGFFEADLYSLHLGPRLPRFWLWLLKEIVKANIAVARIVLHPRLPISPRLITIDARGLPSVSLATLANAITLTPGTLAIDVDQGRIEVHCLTAESAEQTQRGEMLARARHLTED